MFIFVDCMRQSRRWIVSLGALMLLLVCVACGGRVSGASVPGGGGNPPSSPTQNPDPPSDPNPDPDPDPPSTPTPGGPGANGQYRTVIDTEVASVFQKPSGFSWTEYGAVIGTPSGTLDPDAIRVLLTRFDKFKPADDTAPKSFPYTKLRQFEAAEVAAGRDPIFLTATYQGRKRPVLWAWSLKLQNNVPTAPSENWEYGVNVKDERFIRFWIQQFVRPILWQPIYSNRNQWFELDEGAYNWNLFGVLDDNDHFVAGVPWDTPFPQNESTYLSGVAAFFTKLKDIAPDIRVMPNLGTMSDPTKFPDVFADVPGVLNENIYAWGPSPSPYTRNNWFGQNFTYLPSFGAQGRVGIMRALLPSGDGNALLNSFVTYSLIKGPNFFFSPGTSSTSNIAPSQWSGMKSVLGNPTTEMLSGPAGSRGPGFRLYSREFEGGWVYLNWTGIAQTIDLPAGKTFFDPKGNVVTKVVLPDAMGTYVTSAPQALASPRVMPRFAASMTGAQTVSMEAAAGTTIRYTLDGSAPTSSSATYTAPLQVADGTVVRATAFNSSGANSWSSDAAYGVAPGLPTVSFVNATDVGPIGNYYPVLELSAVPENIVSVQYEVLQSSGTTSGSATFLKNEIHRYFTVPISGVRGSVATITLTGATGANLGSTPILVYSIQ
jgi:hypothetical protein